jgi:hypothetical protein
VNFFWNALQLDTIFFTCYQFLSSQQSCIENVKVRKFKALCLWIVNISFVMINTNDVLLMKIPAVLKWWQTYIQLWFIKSMYLLYRVVWYNVKMNNIYLHFHYRKGTSETTQRDWKWMGSISLWSMLLMLIEWSKS